VAKKTQKKTGATKKVTNKKVAKTSTKKVTTKKVVKKAATKVNTKKVVKKVVKKTVSKKAETKKAPVKKSTTKASVSKPASTTKSRKNGVTKTAAAAAVVTAASNAAAGPKKMITRSNGSAVSERVAKLRLRLGRGGTSATRMLLPEKPLTEAQLKKIKSGLSKADLKYFKDLLLAKRVEILGDFAQLAQDVKSAGEGVSYEHMADTGTDNFEQEFNLGLMESERNMLQRVNRALDRIEDKSYGICIMTGKPINRERLEAKPWAQYSIEVARELDRQGLLDK
jgi:RNA polymerase-binding protein DksA